MFNIGLIENLFNLLYSAIIVFFLCRLSITLVYILNIFKRKKLWSIIFISIIGLYNLSGCFQYLIDLIMLREKFHLQTFLVCAAMFFVIGGLCFGMIKQLGGINFKTKRQREYEREVNGKDRNFLPFIVIAFVALLGSLFSGFYYTLVEVNKTTAIVSFITSGISLLAIVLFIVLQIKADKHKKESKGLVVDSPKVTVLKERTCVLVIEDEFDTFIYKSTHKGQIELKKFIGNIIDYYYVQSYGVLKHKDEEYDLFGFKTSSFDRALLDQIKMEKFDSEVVKAAVPYLEKNRTKTIELDENLNPIDSFDA